MVFSRLLSFASAIAHRFSEEQYKNSKRIFQEYGPTARLCINLAKRPDDLILFKNDRTSTINTLSIRELVKYIDEGGVLNLNATHTVFLVK